MLCASTCYMTEQKTDCWWFSEHIMEKVASWEGRSSWTHTVFSTCQLTTLFSCGGEDNRIHRNPPHKKHHAVKYVSGSTGCQQDILLLLCQPSLPFFMLPSFQPADVRVYLVCVFCVDLRGLIISLRITLMHHKVSNSSLLQIYLMSSVILTPSNPAA